MEQQSHTTPHLTEVPIITGTTTQVNLQTGTIASKLQQTICREAQQPMIKKYIQNLCLDNKTIQIHSVACPQVSSQFPQNNEQVLYKIYPWVASNRKPHPPLWYTTQPPMHILYPQSRRQRPFPLMSLMTKWRTQLFESLRIYFAKTNTHTNSET